MGRCRQLNCKADVSTAFIFALSINWRLLHVFHQYPSRFLAATATLHENALHNQLMAVQDDVNAHYVPSSPSTAVQLEQPSSSNSLPSKFEPPYQHHDNQADEDSPFPSQLPQTPRFRLYLMVLADFGLSFTWLCKFAVAT